MSVLVIGRAAHIQASGIRISNEQQQRELHTSRSGADRRGDRISSRTAEAELDPRCPSSTDRRRKPHSSELGARPLARGGTGDKTFAPSCVSYRWAERTRTCRCHFHDVYYSSWAKGLRSHNVSLKPKRIRPVFQWFTENDVCEFESSQPSHGVGSLCARTAQSSSHPGGVYAFLYES